MSDPRELTEADRELLELRSTPAPTDGAVSEERLRELIAECDSAAKTLGTKCADAAAAGRFVAREIHGARSAKFADVADALRELQALRSTPSTREPPHCSTCECGMAKAPDVQGAIACAKGES